jgi:hypothetical protein
MDDTRITEVATAIDVPVGVSVDLWGNPIVEEDPEYVPLTQADVPNAIFPTNNQWGVPVLDLNMQADEVPGPVTIWGSIGRSRNSGTWLFYTDDYRFNKLWQDPSTVVNTRCTACAEINFSERKQDAMALAMWNTYRKRWVARWWQSRGIRILVDMDVSDRFIDINLLGVPKGWRSFVTRGYNNSLESLHSAYARA